MLLRLLCPLSFESALSLIPIDKQPISQDIIYSQTPQISTGMTVVDNMINPILPAPTDIGASINPIQVWLFIGEIIWISGIVAIAIYSIISFIKLKRSLITSTPLKENIYLAHHIATPFVLGVIRPKIYLPSSLFESEQNYIIGHELCHIKRLDHITRILGFIALSVHWFNPLVWIAFALSGKDMELSCDEAVMKSMDSDIKAEYSQSLLRFSTTKKMIHATPLAFGEGDTKSRVKNVLNYKKPKFWVILVAMIAVLSIAICLATNQKASRQFPMIGNRLSDLEPFEIAKTNSETESYLSNNKTLTTDQAVIKALFATSNRYLGDECFGEGHIILGTEKDGNITKIYTLTMVGYYGFVNNNFEKVSGSGIIPAVVTLKNNNEVDIEYPQDGSDYASSIKEMFPLKYHSRIFGDNDSDRKDLTEQERAYAKEYLSKIGRKAEIGDYGDFEHTLLTSLGVSVEVSNGLEDFYKAHNYYPYFIGTKEIIEDGVRMVYELSYQESQQEITFTKYLYDSKNLVEQFVFNSITGKQIAQ